MAKKDTQQQSNSPQPLDGAAGVETVKAIRRRARARAASIAKASAQVRGEPYWYPVPSIPPERQTTQEKPPSLEANPKEQVREGRAPVLGEQASLSARQRSYDPEAFRLRIALVLKKSL